MKLTGNHSHGLVLAILAANLFSSKVLLVKLAYLEGATPLQVLGIRMAAALPFFAALTILELVRRREDRPGWRDYLGMSTLGLLGYYLASVLDFHGIVHLSSSMERLLLYLYPSFVVLIRSVAERSRPGRWEVSALILAYTGLALVYHDERMSMAGNVFLGSALVLGSALSFAFYLYWSSHYVKKFGSRFFASYSTSVSCMVILVHSLLASSPGDPAFDSHLLLTGLALGIFCTVLPTLAMHRAISLIGPARVAILGTSGIVAPMVLGTLLFGEPLALLRLTGTVLILLSVVFLSRK